MVEGLRREDPPAVPQLAVHCKGGSATAPFVLAVSPLKLSFSGIFV